VLLKELADTDVAAGAAVAGLGVRANVVNRCQSQSGNRLHDGFFTNLQAVADDAGNAFLTGGG
jgi:hypothetical protein